MPHFVQSTEDSIEERSIFYPVQRTQPFLYPRVIQGERLHQSSPGREGLEKDFISRVQIIDHIRDRPASLREFGFHRSRAVQNDADRNWRAAIEAKEFNKALLTALDDAKVILRQLSQVISRGIGDSNGQLYVPCLASQLKRRYLQGSLRLLDWRVYGWDRIWLLHPWYRDSVQRGRFLLLGANCAMANDTQGKRVSDEPRGESISIHHVRQAPWSFSCSQLACFRDYSDPAVVSRPKLLKSNRTR